MNGIQEVRSSILLISTNDDAPELWFRGVLIPVSRCSAAGSVPALGAGGREFESRHFDQQRDAAPNSRPIRWGVNFSFMHALHRRSKSRFACITWAPNTHYVTIVPGQAALRRAIVTKQCRAGCPQPAATRMTGKNSQKVGSNTRAVKPPSCTPPLAFRLFASLLSVFAGHGAQLL